MRRVVHDKKTALTEAEWRELGKELVARYYAGESARSLADSVGRSHSFTYGLLKEAGMTFREKPGFLSIAEQRKLGQDLARRYEAGESIRSLAQSIGRSDGYTHMLLQEAGVTFRAPGWVSARTRNGR